MFETRQAEFNGVNIYNGDPWKLTISYEGETLCLFLQTKETQKLFADPYLAMRTMLDLGLFSLERYEDAIFSLIRDYAAMEGWE